MANVKIRNVTYYDLPAVAIPDATSGNDVLFYDTSDASSATRADVRNGVKVYTDEGEIIGNMTEKAAATITPTSSQQTIDANQYLVGAQTVEAVTTTNLTASNIVYGVVVKVGTATDDDSVATVTGNVQVPVITQDSVTKILSIS